MCRYGDTGVEQQGQYYHHLAELSAIQPVRGGLGYYSNSDGDQSLTDNTDNSDSSSCSLSPTYTTMIPHPIATSNLARHTTRTLHQRQQQQTQQHVSMTTPKKKKAKSTYKHVPHCEKAPHLVAKRNARERRRVMAVNNAFTRLRKHVPCENRNKRISKVKTLKIAIDYIYYLQDLIDEHDHQSRMEQQLRKQMNTLTASAYSTNGTTVPPPLHSQHSGNLRGSSVDSRHHVPVDVPSYYNTLYSGPTGNTPPVSCRANAESDLHVIQAANNTEYTKDNACMYTTTNYVSISML